MVRLTLCGGGDQGDFPLIEIRSGGMYGARSIFAEQEYALDREICFTPAGAKMHSLRICRPGASKTREANPLGGSVGGSQDPHAVPVQSVTEQVRFVTDRPKKSVDEGRGKRYNNCTVAIRCGKQRCPGESGEGRETRCLKSV